MGVITNVDDTIEEIFKEIDPPFDDEKIIKAIKNYESEFYWQPICPLIAELVGPLECPVCGGHVSLEWAYLEQVSDKVTCPYCNTTVRVGEDILGEEYEVDE